jgi:hypothetical protein
MVIMLIMDSVLQGWSIVPYCPVVQVVRVIREVSDIGCDALHSCSDVLVLNIAYATEFIV